LKKHEPQHPTALISEYQPVFRTSLGGLYQGDCLQWLRSVPDEVVDLVFADPPFNLKKLYGKGISDDMAEHEYLDWCFAWIDECVRVLKPGGALYLFNLPKWSIHYGAHMHQRGMTFRHWIACRMPKSMPIPGRMSPSHYALLYYTKGKPKTFHVVRQPVQTCRHCGGEVRDYGGHRKALNPAGLRLQDFFDAPDEVFEDAPYVLPKGKGWTQVDELWEDIPPVRHARHKHREANALAPILLERVIAQSTDPGDVVLDPFGGTGTTYIAAERKERRWLGVEIGDTAPAIARMKDFIAGDAPEWERARGNGSGGRKRNRNQLDML
jgi:site-specific DNA-methyltransferase (adenine-specific)